MTTTAPFVREARSEERTRIVELTHRAYAEYARVMTPAAWQGLASALDASLAHDEGVTRLVAELDGAVVGSAALYSAAGSAYGDLASIASRPEIRLVAVDPASRGRGVARALLLDCIRRAREAGHTTLGLHTSRSMRDALRLYQRMGFVRDTTQDFQPPGAELVEGYCLSLIDPAPPSAH